MTPEQEAALRRFITTNGYRWKYKLRSVWLSDGSRIPDAALLRQLRNQLGPEWLEKFKGFKK